MQLYHQEHVTSKELKFTFVGWTIENTFGIVHEKQMNYFQNFQYFHQQQLNCSL